MNYSLIIACPKGRLESKVVKYLAQRGLVIEKDFFDDEIRKLTFNTNIKEIKIIKLKPSDIRSYTILGAADIGFVGYDDILENSAENISDISEEVFPKSKKLSYQERLKQTRKTLAESEKENFQKCILLSSAVFYVAL